MTNSPEIYGIRVDLAPTPLFIVVGLLFAIICCIAVANDYAGVKGLAIVLLGVLCAVLLAFATYTRV